MLFSSLPARTQPWTETDKGKATDAKRREERERGDAGESENQPALTLRQSISPPLGLFPMGWPG